VPVNRGPSLSRTNHAIAEAAIADALARQEREEARQRRNEEASRAVIEHPNGIALVDPRK
jgi:hypothetical protein